MRLLPSQINTMKVTRGFGGKVPLRIRIDGPIGSICIGCVSVPHGSALVGRAIHSAMNLMTLASMPAFYSYRIVRNVIASIRGPIVVNKNDSQLGSSDESSEYFVS
ncbi:unnamed protein product [Fusarium graminearum]|uniref:Uncharacterized protein n=1 Tax=Gibberella zeae TaxID=5518 RepID=A0A4E9EKL9_GIBZA|nr:unnamed protein product [Fusarium graminearum]CAG1988587.1 unnamed protein product [Fusarium graminearum]